MMADKGNLTNGFSLDEIGILYLFLVDYETSYTDFNAKEFNKEFPKFKRINELLELSKQVKANMIDTIPAPVENHVLMTEGKQPSHFLKHLRHAFAHSQLIKKASFIELKDYPLNERQMRKGNSKKNQGPKHYSAYGIISQEVFDEILKLLSHK